MADMRTTKLVGVAAAASVVLLAGGCSGTQDAPAARAAEQLVAAVDSGDGAAACDLLAPATRSELESTSGSPCAEAVLEEDLGPPSTAARTQVFDTMAQVVVGTETLFLSRFDGEWRVTAAACTPVPGGPYDCSIGLP